MHGKRVLLIEDSAPQGALFKRQLEHGGAIVTLADNYEAQRLDWREYDLVVTDLMMPGIDGDTLIRRMAKTGDLPPVVLMSAVPHERIEEITAELYHDGLLVVPLAKVVSGAGLVERLLQILAETNGE